nr:MAG TPA: hypothetical protein [Caudoviricetes sp.]
MTAKIEYDIMYKNEIGQRTCKAFWLINSQPITISF